MVLLVAIGLVVDVEEEMECLSFCGLTGFVRLSVTVDEPFSSVISANAINNVSCLFISFGVLYQTFIIFLFCVKDSSQ